MSHAKKFLASVSVASVLFGSFGATAQALTMTEAVNSIQAPPPATLPSVANPRGNIGYILANLFYGVSDGAKNGLIKPEYVDIAGLNTWIVSGLNAYFGLAGNVGIGTASPGARLHVVTATGGTSAIFTDSANSSLYVRHPSNGLVRLDSDSWNRISFSDGGVDNMTIDGAGNVGIGTASPASVFHISEKDDTWASSFRMNRSWDAGTDYFQMMYDYQGLKFRTMADGTDEAHIIFKPKNAEAMRINEDGNVGIGTSAPSAKLEVAGNVIASDPTAANHVATKSYVDGKAASSNDQPVMTTSLFGENGDMPVQTVSTSPITIGTVYGPFANAVGNYACPSGTTKQHKVIIAYVDNVASGGQSAMFRIAFANAVNRDFNLGSTWWASPYYRTYDSGYFTETNANQADMKTWINGTAGPYVNIRKVDLLTFCR